MIKQTLKIEITREKARKAVITAISQSSEFSEDQVRLLSVSSPALAARFEKLIDEAFEKLKAKHH